MGLAGCNTLLIISGATYTTRLWCCTELFVYTHMLTEDEPTQLPIVKVLGADEQERARVRNAWNLFDASVCECVSDFDKKRIFAVIDRYPGGVKAFSEHIQALARHVFPAESWEDAVPEVGSDDDIVYSLDDD